MLIFDKYTQFPKIRGDYKAFSFQYVKELFISAPRRARESIRGTPSCSPQSRAARWHSGRAILGGTEQTARRLGNCCS